LGICASLWGLSASLPHSPSIVVLNHCLELGGEAEGL
jgi:hypothetical protein